MHCGRTTRMLQVAIDYAQEHGKSNILVLDNHKDLITERVNELVGVERAEERYGRLLWLKGGGEIMLLGYNDSASMRLGNTFREGWLFADHCAIKQWAGWALDEYHRYDEDG